MLMEFLVCKQWNVKKQEKMGKFCLGFEEIIMLIAGIQTMLSFASGLQKEKRFKLLRMLVISLILNAAKELTVFNMFPCQKFHPSS